MSLFSFLKKEDKGHKRPELNAEQKMSRDEAIRLHRIRIANLTDERRDLTTKLESIESDFNASKSKRGKESDTVIRRMSLLKYEIDIREGLVKWLS